MTSRILRVHSVDLKIESPLESSFKKCAISVSGFTSFVWTKGQFAQHNLADSNKERCLLIKQCTISEKNEVGYRCGEKSQKNKIMLFLSMICFVSRMSSFHFIQKDSYTFERYFIFYFCLRHWLSRQDLH